MKIEDFIKKERGMFSLLFIIFWLILSAIMLNNGYNSVFLVINGMFIGYEINMYLLWLNRR